MSQIINSLDRTPTVANVVDDIRFKIISQEYRSGDPITEMALAGEYGISRGSVRTALQTLEGEGVIVTLPNGRKQVLGLTEKYIQDLYHTRMIVECEAARQILARKSVNFTVMAAMVSEFRAMTDAPPDIMREERMRVNMEFHRALLAMSENRPLMQCWNTFDSMLGALIKFNADTILPEAHDDKYVLSHSKILEMFLAQDPEVVEYLEFHAYEAAYKDTLEGLKLKGCL